MSDQAGARGRWAWRDLPAMGWFVAVAVTAIAHRWLPQWRWLMVHMVLLGALTHAAMVWSAHFTRALLKSSPTLDPRRQQSLRLTLLFVGTLAVVAGVGGVGWTLTLCGAVVVCAAVTWHGIQLVRQLHGALAGRFRTSVHHYLAAATCLPVGAVLGVLLARGPSGEWHGRLLVAHTMTMLLGWIGLTVIGTLITLWPTMLRTRMDDRAERLAAQALPLFVVALAVAVSGALLGARALAVGGLTAYLIALLWWGRALWLPARHRPPRQMSTLSVTAALIWALIGIGWVMGTIVLRRDWAQIAGTYGVPAAVFAAGFGAQLLIGALSYLVPSVLGGGPTAVRASQEWVDRGSILRLVVTNGGLALSLLPIPSAVRVIVTSLVLAAFVSFIPLLLSAVRASTRSRPGPGSPLIPTGPVRISVWSSGQLVSGLAVLALAVSGGLVADPSRVAQVPQAAEVSATGRITTVTVETRGMAFHPSSVSVPHGDRLIIELTNADPTTPHDLVFANGVSSARLSPGARERIDVGVIGSGLDGWCSIVGHRQMGMVFRVEVTGAPAGSGAQATSPSAPDVAYPSGPTDHGGHVGGHSGHGGSGPVMLHGTPDASFAAVDPVLPAIGPGTLHKVTFTVRELELEVAPGLWQKRWTFNGAVPGPTLHGRIGDTFEVTLVNEGTMGHSIDFHAGELAPDVPMRTIPPGESLVYRFTANRAGIWMYHCSTMPMATHIAAGMHGAVVIDPPGLAPVDKEFVMVQSEVFLGPDRARGSASPVNADGVVAERPDAVVFNGIASQYDHRPLKVTVGERVRFWVLDAGPNRESSFHIVGGQFDTVYAEGAWRLRARPGQPDAPGGSQALGLFAAQGGFVELSFTEPGRYPFVTHVMVDAERGAHGIVEVSAP